MIDASRVNALMNHIADLSESQFVTIENIVLQLQRPSYFWRNPHCNLVSDCLLQEFGDTLRIHHCFSHEAFGKDRFEHALAKVFHFCGGTAALARTGNPGHDITINAVAFSLKTEASSTIKVEFVHISKFMELGRGQWSDQIEDLKGLRDQFLQHMTNYDSILTLRKLPHRGFHFYELIEIPTTLLQEAALGDFEMRFDSSQNPKPGTCTVKNPDATTRFQLYFDGGTERKLQIKRIDKSLCTVHATWKWEDDTQII